LITAPHVHALQTRWAYNSIRRLKSKLFASPSRPIRSSLPSSRRRSRRAGWC